MKKPTYEFGVEWIALNDEPGITNWAEMEGLISVLLLADLFDRSPGQVAADVVTYRIKHEVGK